MGSGSSGVSGGGGGGTSGGTGTATISWAAVSGATSYTILSSKSATGPFTKVGASTSTTFTDTTVQHGTTYYYQIVSVVVVQ
jgi:cellulose 1,4-beta-cellobiosidase